MKRLLFLSGMLLSLSSIAAENVHVSFFKKYCTDCHGPKKAKGKITLHNIGLDFEAAESRQIWMAVYEQLESKNMPPEGETQPSAAEKSAMVKWISKRFRESGESLESIRANPKFGNYVNHEDLFSGKYKGPAYTPSRLWRVSPFIHGKNSPFTLSQEEGFKDYAHMFSIDRPTLELIRVRVMNEVRQMMGPTDEEIVLAEKLWRQGYITRGKKAAEKLKQARAAFKKKPKDTKLIKNLENAEKANIRFNYDLDNYDPKDRKWFHLKRPAINMKNNQKRNPLYQFSVIEGPPNPQTVSSIITTLLGKVFKRQPTDEEVNRMSKRLQDAAARHGNKYGLSVTLASILMLPESLYRSELGLGKKLLDGRRLLSRYELIYALNYAMYDEAPDRKLIKTFEKADFSDRETIRKYVDAFYNQGVIERPGKAARVYRFFREYFDYEKATKIFKDGSRHPGFKPRVADLVEDTDLLIKHILQEDKDVLRQMLTTDLCFVKWIPTRPGWLTLGSYNLDRKSKLLTPENKAKWRYKVRLPNRSGILTQPVWLTAMSGNFDNDPVRRGKWVYEHLLGGVIPDVPVTVDAQIPEDHDKTLRERFGKTNDEYCWNCHKRMNPYGMAFEMFDDVGRFRKEELLRDNKTKVPIVTKGAIVKSGVDGLDGEVENAVEMLKKLADTDRVRQVFVRHVFRYIMGRNETLNDSPTLISADKVFKKSGGSMKALFVSLLSSDSFIYRKDID